MDGVRQRRVQAAAKTSQTPVQRLGQERRKRRHGLRELEQAAIQRRIGRKLVAIVLRPPETRTIEADVGIRELLDELEQARDHVVEAITLHLRRHGALQGLQAREDPAIEHILRVDEARHRRPIVDLRVGREEVEGVVPGQQGTTRHVAHAHVREALLLRLHESGVDQIKTQRVRTLLCHEYVGSRVVLLRLRHLGAVLREDETIDNDVAERRLIEERGSEHGQRVEPAARLIKALGDELGRKARLEHLGVLERIVQLCVGHGPRLEPAVEHLGNTPIDASFAIDRELQRVDELAMQVLYLHPSQFGKLGPRPDAAHGAGGVVDPERQGRPPHPIA